MRKVLVIIFSVCLAISALVALSACTGGQGEKGPQGEQGIPGLQGERGEKGEKGEDGATPTMEISNDGYWVINGVKTAYKAVGEDGMDGNDGKDGHEIESVYYDENGGLVIVYTDKTEQTITLPEHVHVASDWIVDTQATCTSQGLRHKECTGCHTYMDIELTEEAHEWETTYSYDDTRHWIECVKCGKVQADSSREHRRTAAAFCAECGCYIPTEGVICEASEDGTYAKIVGYEGEEPGVYLPGEYRGLPVTHIASNAFEKNEIVKSVFFPTNLTTVESEAFNKCPNLMLFSSCKNRADEDHALKKIAGDAFIECSSLAVVSLTKNVEDISFFAFNKCNNLRAILVPEQNLHYKNIGNHLYTKDGKTLVRYAPGVLNGESGDSVKHFIIPDGVERIERRAFWGAHLETVVFSETLRIIGNDAFWDCNALSRITLPDSVEAIGEGAFFGCGNLQAVQLNNGLKAIGSSAFEYSGIESIVIPASVESLKSFTFANCSSLKTVVIQDNSRLTEIPIYLFYRDTALESVAFGTNSMITRIGNSSFNECSSLKTIELPEGVKYIDYGAFEGCLNLQSVKFPTTLQILSSHSFYDCESLSEIAIPAATTSIDHNAFTGCDALMKITVEQGNSVYHADGNCIIETAAKKLLIGCTGSVLPQDDSVTEIGMWAFGDNPCLKKIEISEYITKIDITSFCKCGGLEEIIVNQNNPVFHEDGNCLINTAEKKILRLCSNSTIPSDGSVTTFQNGAFDGCSIRNLYIPACIEFVTSSGPHIRDLESIVVEEGNTKYYSAGNCLISTSSQTLYIGCKNSMIPSGVLKIRSDAFKGCGVTSINIPASVTEIETFAFLDCVLLQEIRYEGTREQWLLIEKDRSWDSNTGDYIIICSDGVLLKNTVAGNVSKNLNENRQGCEIKQEGGYAVFHFDATKDGVQNFIFEKRLPELEYALSVYRVRNGLLIEHKELEGSGMSQAENFSKGVAIQYSVDIVESDRYYIVVKYVDDGEYNGFGNMVILTRSE